MRSSSPPHRSLDGASRTDSRTKGFDPSVHHPVAETLKHTISPLSAALFVFTVGTVAKRPAIRAWWTARRTLGLWNTVGWRRSVEFASPGVAADVKASSSTSSVVPSGVRAYSTTTAADRSWSARSRPSATVVPTRGRRHLAGAPLRGRPPLLGPFRLAHATAASRWPLGLTGSSRLVATSAGANALTAANQHEAAGTANASAAVSCGPTEHVFPTLAEGLLSSSHHNGAASSPALLEKLAQLYPPDVVNSVAAHIYDFPLTPLMDYALTNLHAITGLPWWASIVAMTMLLRVAVLPLNISFMRHQLRVKCIQPLLARHYAQLKAAGTPEEAHAHARETLSLLSAKKARPLIAWWTPVVFPLYFVSWFAAVHNHSISNPELLTGGTLWFSDLTATDPTFLLPVAASLTWLGIIEMGASALYLQSASLKMWTRFTALAFIPVLSTLPSGVFCFWVSSNLWELVRIHLFNKDSVRKVFGIPLRSELPAVTPVAW